MPKYRTPRGRVIERSEDYARRFPHWERVDDSAVVDKEICIPCGDSPVVVDDGWYLTEQPDPVESEDDKPSDEDKE
jgi:hypothetical protein